MLTVHTKISHNTELRVVDEAVVIAHRGNDTHWNLNGKLTGLNGAMRMWKMDLSNGARVLCLQPLPMYCIVCC